MQRPTTSGATGRSPGSKQVMLEHTINVLQGAQRTEETGMNAAQVASCFRALDSIIPEVGMCAQGLKLLRDELFDAVHSDEYTANMHGEVERIPYFTLLAGLHAHRNRDAERESDAARHANAELRGTRLQLDEANAELRMLRDNQQVRA
jgi:hypothetical protein